MLAFFKIKEELTFGLSRFWPPIHEAGLVGFFCRENLPVLLTPPGSEVLWFFCTALKDFLQRKPTDKGGILQPESGLAPGAHPLTCVWDLWLLSW